MFSKCQHYYMVEIGKGTDWVCVASNLEPHCADRVVDFVKRKLCRHAVSARFVGDGHGGLEAARRFMREHKAHFHTIHKMLV